MGFSLFTDLITPTRHKIPDAPQIDIGAEQLAAIQGNAASFGAAKALATDFNAFMREQLKVGIPGFVDLSNELAKNLAAQLRGELTSSDLASEQRSSAARALGLGIGGSKAGAAFTARNIGLRQYQIQQGAQTQAPNYLQTMAGITPMFDFSHVFMSPAQRINVSQWNKENAWNAQFMKNQMKAQPEPWMKALAGFGDSLTNTAAAFYTGGLLGGGMGGGGGGGSGVSFMSAAGQQNRLLTGADRTGMGYF